MIGGVILFQNFVTLLGEQYKVIKKLMILFLLLLLLIQQHCMNYLLYLHTYLHLSVIII